MKNLCLFFLKNILSIIIVFNLTYAQDKQVRFDRFSTRDGLSQNRIFDIVQDTLGFIWIATEDGLNRYDGYEFTIFKNMPNDSTSLINNFIQTLHVSKKGDLWLGGALSGLSKFNFENETFVNYQNNHFDQKTIISNNVIDISEDEKSNLWLATVDQGFDYLDVSSGIFYHMANMLPQGYEFSNEFLRIIHQDRAGRLWVGGQGKLHLFRVEYHENGIPKLKPIKVINQLFQSAASSIEEDKNGKIWIGTVREGLFQFIEEKSLLEPFLVETKNIDLLKMQILCIESDEDGNLWIGGFYSEDGINISFDNGYGVLNIDSKVRSLRQFKNNPEDEKSVSSSDIGALFIDDTGVLWVGTDLAGINKYDKTVIKYKLLKPSSYIESTFNTDAARGFYLDNNNRFWIAAAGGGIIKFDRSSKDYEHYLSDPNNINSISSNFTMNIYDDGRYLWFGTLEGLNRFDPKEKIFRRFYLDPTQISGVSGTRQTAINSINYNIIEVDKVPGYLWYGSNGGGLVRFNKNDFSFKNYTYDPENENSLNNRDNFVRTIFYTKSFPDELWTGSTHGINIFNLKTETFRYYTHDSKNPNSLSNDNVMQFYEDEKGYIWISTYGGGLNRFNPKTEEFLHFTESNCNIPNNAVYGVLPDEQGNLWMSTNNGISKFNPNTLDFRNYTVDDGLQSEEFNGGAVYKSSNGEMFFGGIEGLNYFYPKEVIDNPAKPEIVLTNLKIFNESVKVGAEDSPLKKQISNTKEIKIAHWQNDISFEYVGLHYANSPKNRYAFKLENYEDDWRKVGNIRIATYTNLDPGEYIFHVKGANSDGLWNDEGTSIKLTISPPWWRTYWAYFGYVLFFVFGIFAFDRIQRARVKAQERRKAEITILEAENERKSQELEEARELQLSMLPKELPQLPYLDIAVYMQTATEVGGDYYDFHVGLDGTLTVVIGDATGHGMKAGTMVTAAKSLFRSYASNPDILFSFKEWF